MKVSISKGNSKMGAIPSVSLPPITTCAAGCTCAKKCYAAKLCRIYPSVKKSYENNLAVYLKNPESYFGQIKKAAAAQRFFRWHVSGDIVSPLYLAGIVGIAAELPKTEFLAFTKRYDIVNDFISDGYKIPENLHLIFSAWPGMDMPNPYSLPVAQVIFKGQEPADDWKVCGGNCTECACRGVGCWELKNGETIAFYEH